MNKQAIFEGHKQILQFLNRLTAVLKNTLELEQWTKRNQSLQSEPIGNDEKGKEIQYGRQISTKSQFSNTVCFHLLLTLFLFVQIFELPSISWASPFRQPRLSPLENVLHFYPQVKKCRQVLNISFCTQFRRHCCIQIRLDEELLSWSDLVDRS